jgi:hypothetical protein
MDCPAFRTTLTITGTVVTAPIVSSTQPNSSPCIRCLLKAFTVERSRHTDTNGRGGDRPSIRNRFLERCRRGMVARADCVAGHRQSLDDRPGADNMGDDIYSWPWEICALRANSGEILSCLIAGQVSLADYGSWLTAATCGNIAGGVVMVSLLNYGQAKIGKPSGDPGMHLRRTG